MIFGNTTCLEQSCLPLPLQKLLARPEFQLAALLQQPDGTYTVEGKQVFYMLSTNQTQPMHERRSEFHKQYIDIQLVLSGDEVMAVGPLPDMHTDYPPAAPDLFFVPDVMPDNQMTLHAGDFALFYPGELHRPLCAAAQGASVVRKAVIKIDRTWLV